MHPAFLYWWKYGRRQAECDAWAGHGTTHPFRPWEGRFASGSGHYASMGSSSFGVRRPLRFLAYKLDLDEAQVGAMARILDELKTERAQADVDARRAASAFAESVEGSSFDEVKAAEGATSRAGGAERVRAAVVKALREIHAVLSPEQRTRLAYLIRTGALSL